MFAILPDADFQMSRHNRTACTVPLLTFTPLLMADVPLIQRVMTAAEQCEGLSRLSLPTKVVENLPQTLLCHCHPMIPQNDRHFVSYNLRIIRFIYKYTTETKSSLLEVQ